MIPNQPGIQSRNEKKKKEKRKKKREDDAYCVYITLYSMVARTAEQRALLPSCNKSLFFYDGSDHPHGRRCESRGSRACAHDKPHFSQSPASLKHALASSISSPTYPSNHPARVISSPRPSHVRRRALRLASSVANLQHTRHQGVDTKTIRRQPTRSTTRKGRG